MKFEIKVCCVLIMVSRWIYPKLIVMMKCWQPKKKKRKKNNNPRFVFIFLQTMRPRRDYMVRGILDGCDILLSCLKLTAYADFSWLGRFHFGCTSGRNWRYIWNIVSGKGITSTSSPVANQRWVFCTTWHKWTNQHVNLFLLLPYSLSDLLRCRTSH